MRTLCLAVLTAGLTICGAAVAEVQLRSQAQASGDTLTLGDLFEGLDAKANIVVGPAPAPGSRATYQVKHIVALARIHGLDWRPTGREAPLVVARGGQQFGRGEVIDRLRDELRARGYRDRLEIDLAGRLYDAGFKRTGAALALREFELNQISGQFSATLVVTSHAGQREYLPLSGRALAVRRVPVVQRLIRRGETISEADVGWTELRLAPGTRGIAETMDAVLGQAARRPLRPGDPLQEADLTAPIIVQKGTLVTMVLQAPGLVLTSTGRALENAAIGEAVRVMNPHSKRTIDATVIGPDQVRVRLRRQFAATTNQ